MKLRFDWRWIGLIVVIAVLINAQALQLPWQVPALILGGAGAYLLWVGWRVWIRAGGRPTRGRVTYWRGQRIELSPERRGPALPPLRDIGPAALYFLLGAIFILAALSLVFRVLGW